MSDTVPAEPSDGVSRSLAEALDSLGHAQDAVYIKDRAGRYLMVNAQASLLIGHEPEELVGRTDPEVFGSAGDAVLRTDLELMERGSTEIIEEEPIVVDGEPRIFLRTKTPLRDADGNVVGLVAVSTDISERKRFEEELLRREAQLAEAQELARVGSWEWDIRADTVTWSLEFYDMLGMDPKEVKPTYKGFIDVIHPDDRAAAEGALGRALEGGGSYAVAHRLIRGDGEERMMICRGRVDRDLDGSPLVQRADDRPETVRVRLAKTLTSLNDVAAHYRELGVLRSVDGTRSIDQVSADVIAALSDDSTVGTPH